MDKHHAGRFDDLPERQHLDQRQGEENGDRIIGSGFDFQCRAHALADFRVAGAQQEEHGSRVGRADDGAEQERLDPAEPHQEMRGRSHDADGEQNAECRQHECRRCRLAQRVDRRAEPGIEQDQRQRNRTDEIGRIGVVEFDAETIGAGDEANDKEQQQKGRAEAKGEQRRKRSRQDQRRADERQYVDAVCHAPESPLAQLSVIG